MSPILLLLLLLRPPSGPDTLPADSSFLRATGTSFDVDLYGRVILADSRRNTVSLLSADGTVEVTAGGSGWGSVQFDSPAGVWMRNGIDIFVADNYNHRIQRFDRNLNFVSSLATRESDNPDERFGFPTDVALSRLGELYVCDTENARILKFNRLNRVERSIGDLAAGKGRLRNPTRVEIGPGDKLYVLDAAKVIVFDGFGNYLQTVGEELFGEHPALTADSRGLVVVGDSTIFFFDEEDRPSGAVQGDGLREGEAGTARDIVVAGEDVYLLLGDGIRIMRGVRPPGLTK
jgi:hypothetical protein